MFDFRNATGAQRAAISVIDGPVIIKGGPGTGKTWGLPRRAAYMVLERGIPPQNILLLTNTAAAASQLRIQTDEVFESYGISWAAPRVEVTAFSSYCAGILAAWPSQHQMPLGTRILDAFAQQFLIYLHYPALRRAVPGMYLLEDEVPEWMLEGHEERWVYSGAVRDTINRLTSALVDWQKLQTSDDPGDRLCSALKEQYDSLLKSDSLTDTAAVQAAAFALLRDTPQALARARAFTKYLLIDDYQNSSAVEAQTCALLAGRDGNICVCADEDQALGRARGGRTDNVFGFPTLVPEHVCQTIVLDINFRSNEDIIRFTDAWMRDAGPETAGFSWGRFRKPRATAGTGRSLRSPGVVRLSSQSAESWHEEMLQFFRELLESGSGSPRDLSQAVLAAQNTRSHSIFALEEFLSSHGIEVFAPGSPLFFAHREVRTAVGAMWLAYRGDKSDLRITDDVRQYYETCALTAEQADQGKLADWIRAQNGSLLNVTAGALSRPPFASWTRMSGGGPSAAALRTALIARALDKCMRLPALKGHADRDRLFLEWWLPVLLRNGLADNAQERPRGALSVRSLYMPSGDGVPLEIVVVPDSFELNTAGAAANRAERQYSADPPAEPASAAEWFDLWRTYYRVFSDAENLLLLTGVADDNTDGILRLPTVQALPDARSQAFYLGEFSFRMPKEHAGTVPVPPITTTQPASGHAAAAQAMSGQKKNAPPSAETRRFYRSLSVSAAGHNNVHNQTADDEHSNHESDDE